MKCACGGQIKKGVTARIHELAEYDKPHHPKNRPHYQYIMPLAEILSQIYDKGITTKYVQTRYDNLINEFTTEIDVLLNVDLDRISSIDQNLSNVLEQYRQNNIKIETGRGGQYGKIILK